MSLASRTRPTRLVGLLLIGPVFLALLILAAWINLKLAGAGITGFIAEAFTLKPIRQFGLSYLGQILLPVYLVAGLLVWPATLLPGLLACPTWLRDWRGREAFGFGLSALLWGHLVLWWQVPSTLWVLPGLRSLPFWVIFPLLAIAALAFPVIWLLGRASRLRQAGALVLWLGAWSLLVLLPGWLPKLRPASLGGDQPCKVLYIGLDGLRSDTYLKQAGNLEGIRYRNTYTVIPATRLLWHILWGGDPLTFTIGHVGASKDEFMEPHSLQLLKKAKDEGWKPRFYMDDGGTISIAGRYMDLDDSLMPAAGWENFVNSNLAVSFPLYAVWENWFKPFPTTNPWAPLDAGLREALRLGRGSGWVMFHSCLAHQPIFLTRSELGSLGLRWWALPPQSLQPKVDVRMVKEKDLRSADPRINAFRAYEIRMASILRAWEPIWNGLDQDPHYGGAARFLFSDHGERYHHVTDTFQLQGVHGYSLDPWECRAAMLAAGPGFSDKVEPEPRDATMSLLALVRGVTRVLDGKGALDAAFLESAQPRAPMRYHTLATDAFGQAAYDFRAEPEKDLAVNTFVAPGGIWYTEYTTSAEERAKDASVAWAEGPQLHVFRPLKEGGAREFVYEGYTQVADNALTEEQFQKAKADVEKLLSDPTLRPAPAAPTKP